jgi:hypothetical protein
MLADYSLRLYETANATHSLKIIEQSIHSNDMVQTCQVGQESREALGLKPERGRLG